MRGRAVSGPCGKVGKLMDKVTFDNDCVDCAWLLYMRIRDHFGETLGHIWADLYVGDERGRGVLLPQLIAISYKTKFAREALQRIWKFHIAEHIPAPTILEHYLLGWVKILREDPEARERESYANFVRDLAFVGVVNCLSTETGINATRNLSRIINGKKGDYPKCCYEGGSAIDIVGTAMGKYGGESLGYKWLEVIWLESGLPESPIYRDGPSTCPIMKYPINILRDHKRKKGQHCVGGFMEQTPLKDMMRRSTPQDMVESSEIDQERWRTTGNRLIF